MGGVVWWVSPTLRRGAGRAVGCALRTHRGTVGRCVGTTHPAGWGRAMGRVGNLPALRLLICDPRVTKVEGAPQCPLSSQIGHHSGTRIGQALQPNAFANSFLPVFGSIRHGRKIYFIPGGGGGREVFLATLPVPSAGRILPLLKVRTTTALVTDTVLRSGELCYVEPLMHEQMSGRGLRQSVGPFSVRPALVDVPRLSSKHRRRSGRQVQLCTGASGRGA